MSNKDIVKHQRNPAIELYRVMLMFGICLLHSITMGGHNVPWAANILLSCVVGFVFISGWFGVKFSWLKLAKLYGVGAYAALVLFVGLCLRDGGGYALNATKAYNQLVHGFWFLHAYAFMMMLAPLVNAAIDKGGKTSVMTVAPFVVMVWCWGFGLTLPIIGDKLPCTPGLDAYGGITLLAIYAAARLCRMFEMDKKIKAKWLWLALPVLWFATGIGLGDYNSPFAFALAGACFLLVSKVKLGEWVGRLVMWLAPSMLAVYLVHTNEIGFALLKWLGCALVGKGMPFVCAVGLDAILVFFGALLIDIIRRLLISLARYYKEK